MPKMNVNAFSQKDYENEPPSGPKKTNPKQTQFLQRPKLNKQRSFRIFRLAFEAFYVRILIEANPKGQRRGRPIKCVLGRENLYERMEN